MRTVLLLLLWSCSLLAKQTICLNMIVKNEVRVIERCLESVKPLIDTWVIVDTGSTDGTQERIRSCLAGIPGELYERPWKNFGYNRTEAVKLARNKADYILFMDADDLLDYPEGYQFPPLTEGNYQMWRGVEGYSYLKPQLARGDLPWKWVGVTHEYLACDEPHTTALLEGVRYRSGDGGASSYDPEKFWKNIRLLEEGLKQEPLNNRYAFYLAESYRDAGEPERAIECYLKHNQLPRTWDEEAFWSLFQIAKLREKLGASYEESLENYERAHRARPHRPEPIYHLADWHNRTGHADLAYERLRGWFALPERKERDALFNEDWIKDWGLLFQLSLAAYSIGNDAEALLACEELLQNPRLPSDFRTHVEANRLFPLKRLQEQGRAQLQKEDLWRLTFQSALHYEKKEEWEKAFQTYLEAYRLEPTRSEPLLQLAKHYRIAGNPQIATLFAKEGAMIAACQTSFSEEMAPYQFDEELSISAYYTPFKKLGEEAAQRLLIQKGVPYAHKEQAYRNSLFYIQPLKNARFEPITIELPLHWNVMNPSIRKTREGYQMICRVVNFLHENDDSYTMIDGNPEIHICTRNFLVEYDREFRLLSQKEILEAKPRLPLTQWRVEGLEDCRLFEFNKENWLTCTMYLPSGPPQVALAKLTPALSNLLIHNLTLLHGPDPQRCEKNWLPFVHKNTPLAIYSYDPFLIYALDPSTGNLTKFKEEAPPFDFSRFRGSAAPIPFDGGYLLMVHEVIFAPTRKYTHRFVYLDANFHISALSKPFYFESLGVEYCCGMTLDHSGRELLIPIGINDKRADLCRIDLETVRSLLEIKV